MKTLAAIGAILVLASCGGVMTDPDGTVQTFHLYADNLGSLLSKECVDMYGGQEKACTPYPNMLECDTMAIRLLGDGRMMMNCQAKGKTIKSGLATVADGSPFLCRASADLGCHTCVDIVGNTVHDTCHRGVALFRQSQGWNAGPDTFIGDSTGSDNTPTMPEQPTDTEQPTTPTEPTTPNGGGTAQCDTAAAANAFAQALNKLLQREGLNISWSPNLSQFGNPNAGFFGGIKGGSTCSQIIADNSKYSQCVTGSGESCRYCQSGGVLGRPMCRCYRVTLAAAKAACGSVPAGCDQSAWGKTLVMAYGLSTQWLFSPSYQGGFYGQNTTPQGSGTFPLCQGSPLVLDLGGNGVAATSPAEGAVFDLMGTGALRTGWVKGDDALLVMDRNGNGRIDDGAELFGEVTGGQASGDGFQALAALDNNRDGRVSRRDPLFGELKVWTDRNGDGVSQPSELASLESVGITSLDVHGTARQSVVDRYGNDLSLQGAFTRADGSTGLMVDVFFATAPVSQ